MIFSKTFEPNSFEKIEKIAAWVSFVFVFAIYLAFPTKNYYWDGIEFASIIENADRLSTVLLHPNHLFYNVFGYIAYKFARFFDSTVRAVEVLQTANVFFGVLNSIVLFFILKKLLRNVYPSLALTLIFSFASTWWKYSTDADAYIPSVLFLLVGFYFVLPDQPPRPFLVASTHAFGMFFHQLAVLFFPVLLFGIYLQTKNRETSKRLTAVLQYAATAFALTFGTYCFCFYLISGGDFDFKKLVVWMTWFSPENGFVFDAGKSFALTMRGNIRLFFEGRFNYFGFNALNIIFGTLLVVSVLLLIVKLSRNLGVFRVLGKTIADKKFYKNPVFLLCVVWISSYTAFLFFFIPGNTFYRLFYFPAFILIIGLLMANAEIRQKGARQWRLALAAAIIFLSNFLFFIRPYSEVRANTPLDMAMRMNGFWSDKSVIYYDKPNTDNRLVQYFNPKSVWIPLKSYAEFETEFSKNYGESKNVWLETALVDRFGQSPKTSSAMREKYVEKSRFELTDPAYNMKFVEIVSAKE